MSVKRAFWGAVIGAASLFAITYATSGNYPLAALAWGVGMMWLVADAKIECHLGTLFFLVYVTLAVIAGLSDALVPLTLLGMSANLAAWDLSRFRARLAGQNKQDTHTDLETRHLRLLAVTMSAGFLIALVPLFFRLAIPFAIVFGVALLTFLALQQSMRSLWLDYRQRK